MFTRKHLVALIGAAALAGAAMAADPVPYLGSDAILFQPAQTDIAAPRADGMGAMDQSDKGGGMQDDAMRQPTSRLDGFDTNGDGQVDYSEWLAQRSAT